MGAQLSKGEATVDGNAVAEKANGQVRIHLDVPSGWQDLSILINHPLIITFISLFIDKSFVGSFTAFAFGFIHF